MADDWSALMGPVDTDVDDLLGDTFQYSPGGAAPFADMQGFANPEEPEISLAGLDPMQDKPRIKVARSKIPQPGQAMRFIVPQLDAPPGTKWRPEQWARSTKGRYWIIELQKAVT